MVRRYQHMRKILIISRLKPHPGHGNAIENAAYIRQFSHKKNALREILRKKSIVRYQARSAAAFNQM